MADEQRPTSPLSLRIAGVVILVFLGWLLFGSALSILRAAIALIGYIVVAFIAFQIGKFVGHHHQE